MSMLNFARIAVASIMLATSLFMAHLILPGAPAAPRDLLPGVALTFVTSIAFGEAFGFYLNEFVRNYISMYAGLASVMIALVYLYWVSLLFVFGGELNAAIMRARAAAFGRMTAEGAHALVLLLGGGNFVRIRTFGGAQPGDATALLLARKNLG